jgi:hypothetical protein
MNPLTNEFVFVPIPEARTMAADLATPYSLMMQSLARFERSVPAASARHVRLPAALNHAFMHLDPDFEQLTYGDSGTRRGKELTTLSREDLVVFYSGLQPVSKCQQRLVYALVGLYYVSECVRVGTVPPSRWFENAHTRCVEREASDVIVRAEPGRSGRLKQCIPIGEFRDRAYRVSQGILENWGGLTCRNGYLQRSAVPPALLDPRRFMRWFERQKPELVNTNNV